MKSCPKCGSVKVEIRGKIGECLNPSCYHIAPSGHFRGLNGTERARDGHPKPGTIDYLKGGGVRKLPHRFDE